MCICTYVYTYTHAFDEQAFELQPLSCICSSVLAFGLYISGPCGVYNDIYIYIYMILYLLTRISMYIVYRYSCFHLRNEYVYYLFMCVIRRV